MNEADLLPNRRDTRVEGEVRLVSWAKRLGQMAGLFLPKAVGFLEKADRDGGKNVPCLQKSGLFREKDVLCLEKPVLSLERGSLYLEKAARLEEKAGGDGRKAVLFLSSTDVILEKAGLFLERPALLLQMRDVMLEKADGLVENAVRRVKRRDGYPRYWMNTQGSPGTSLEQPWGRHQCQSVSMSYHAGVRALPAVCLLLAGGMAALLACSGGSSTGAPDAGGDGPTGADANAEPPGDASDSATPPGEAAVDAGPFVPTAANVELIATSPARVLTPPAWNEHLPKLVGDGMFDYAVHTYFTDATDTRYAAILRRPAAPAIGAGQWTEVARVTTPHQPPGVVMDTSLRLHMVFDCLRPGATDVECFPGGAGTQGNTSRFYHLVFATRDGSGALRFDTYGNTNEYTAESNGYHGIGTTADGATWWSLADANWARVVQWSEGAQEGTVATLTVPNAYLLYPIHGAHPMLGSTQLVLYAGEFDPNGGNNASYLASTAFSGNLSGLSELFRRAPPSAAPGTIAAFPSDIAFDAAGTLYALSYLPSDGGQCTELLRFDGGLGKAPTILPVGCDSDYATLHFSRAGVLYLLTDATGPAVTLGVSADRGQSWSRHTIPLQGVPASSGDVGFHGFTPVRAYTSPALFDPDELLFFFYGVDANNGVVNSYMGGIHLAAH